MDISSPNLDLARRALAAIEHRDPSALQSTLHPDVVWRELGSDNPLGDTFEGIGAVLSFIASLYDRTGGSLHLEVHDVLANEEHIVALVRIKALAADGSGLDDEAVLVGHIRDGLVDSVWSYSQDQATANAFWAVVAGGA